MKLYFYKTEYHCEGVELIQFKLVNTIIFEIWMTEKNLI